MDCRYNILLTNKKVQLVLFLCFTGTLQKYNREEAKREVEKIGGIAVSSISKKVNYLVCGEKPSYNKCKKAEELQIPILTEKEFIMKL